ncbi:MAG: hypothetical protein FWE38_03320 [Firmicutes bacterium]|nr:hypothetical protein [Bacillota bacterium]
MANNMGTDWDKYFAQGAGMFLGGVIAGIGEDKDARDAKEGKGKNTLEAEQHENRFNPDWVNQYQNAFEAMGMMRIQYYDIAHKPEQLKEKINNPKTTELERIELTRQYDRSESARLSLQAAYIIQEARRKGQPHPTPDQIQSIIVNDQDMFRNLAPEQWGIVANTELQHINDLHMRDLRANLPENEQLHFGTRLQGVEHALTGKTDQIGDSTSPLYATADSGDKLWRNVRDGFKKPSAGNDQRALEDANVAEVRGTIKLVKDLLGDDISPAEIKEIGDAMIYGARDDTTSTLLGNMKIGAEAGVEDDPGGEFLGQVMTTAAYPHAQGVRKEKDGTISATGFTLANARIADIYARKMNPILTNAGKTILQMITDPSVVTQNPDGTTDIKLDKIKHKLGGDIKHLKETSPFLWHEAQRQIGNKLSELSTEDGYARVHAELEATGGVIEEDGQWMGVRRNPKDEKGVDPKVRELLGGSSFADILSKKRNSMRSNNGLLWALKNKDRINEISDNISLVDAPGKQRLIDKNSALHREILSREPELADTVTKQEKEVADAKVKKNKKGPWKDQWEANVADMKAPSHAYRKLRPLYQRMKEHFIGIMNKMTQNVGRSFMLIKKLGKDHGIANSQTTPDQRALAEQFGHAASEHYVKESDFAQPETLLRFEEDQRKAQEQSSADGKKTQRGPEAGDQGGPDGQGGGGSNTSPNVYTDYSGRQYHMQQGPNGGNFAWDPMMNQWIPEQWMRYRDEQARYQQQMMQDAYGFQQFNPPLAGIHDRNQQQNQSNQQDYNKTA